MNWLLVFLLSCVAIAFLWYFVAALVVIGGVVAAIAFVGWLAWQSWQKQVPEQE